MDKKAEKDELLLKKTHTKKNEDLWQLSTMGQPANFKYLTMKCIKVISIEN